MSFAPSRICLALGKRPTAPIKKDKLPVFLKHRVRIAEARETEYESQVSKALAAGQPIPPFKEPVVPRNLKVYKVSRSRSGNLPVYRMYKNNGDCSTEIRKIEGDSASCLRELNAYLQNTHLDPVRNPPQALLKQVSGNLVIKGDQLKAVRSWMEQKGF